MRYTILKNTLVMKKKILIILGHPNTISFNAALADAYQRGAAGKAEIRRLNLGELDFDPILHKGYDAIQQLEPDLLKAQEDIKWADHLVWIYPTWFGSPPALMMGFISRVFHPSFAFKYRSKKSFIPIKLLQGRSARLIVTMDDYRIIDYFVFFNSVVRVMRRSVLWLSGIKPIRKTILAAVKRSTPEKRENWLRQIEEMGQKLA